MRRPDGRGCAAIVVAIAAGACKHEAPEVRNDPAPAPAAPAPAAPPAAAASDDPWTGASPPPASADCETLPFAPSIPLAEASSAAWLHEPSADVVIVVADSGNDGAYVEVDATTGAVVRRGKLPLGQGAGDDLEGLATDGQRLWGLTSAGWIRAWERDGDRFRLVLGPYPLEHDPACGPQSVNCGHDFEGLCLRPAGTADADGCIGFAASRAEGALYCLDADRTPPDGVAAGAPGGPWPRLQVRAGKKKPKAGPRITRNHALADCAIGGDGAVWTADNLLGGAMVRRLDAPAWQGALGVGFPEAIALAPGGVIYRFSDAGGSPSLSARYRCPAAKAGPAADAIAGAPAAAKP
ncbi:MAG TPA: hypothetical protein VHE35_35740 [Kofleriaceae bacterium]|nr:hypothetical protein [Kofleriaceae bacterium]